MLNMTDCPLRSPLTSLPSHSLTSKAFKLFQVCVCPHCTYSNMVQWCPDYRGSTVRVIPPPPPHLSTSHLLLLFFSPPSLPLPPLPSLLPLSLSLSLVVTECPDVHLNTTQPISSGMSCDCCPTHHQYMSQTHTTS